MPAADTLRLFVALDPPEAVRAALRELPRPLRGVAWTPPHQYHLTLRFIGETPAEKRAAIEQALATVQVESFILPVSGVGSFPPNRAPRVVWVGVGQGHPRLFQLRQRVDDALLACGRAELDVRRFEPHFTLGRCGPDVSASAVAQFLREHREFEAPPFRAEAFTLYQSELKSGGAVHTPLLRVPLRT
jgi:RNA 2',3'-cyclic 3'-phosphodiesterase